MTDSGAAFLRAALRTERWPLFGSAVLFSLHQFGEALVPVIVGLAGPMFGGMS